MSSGWKSILRGISRLLNERESRRYPANPKGDWVNKNPYRYGEEDWVWVEKVKSIPYYVNVSIVNGDYVLDIDAKKDTKAVECIRCDDLSEAKIMVSALYDKYSVYGRVHIPNSM